MALVDFYGQFGNIPLMLDLAPTGDIAELAAERDEGLLRLLEVVKAPRRE